jgi:hypothetical protein
MTLHLWPVAVVLFPIESFGEAVMIPPLECRLRASECERMATQARNAAVRDILLDMARSWTRLALEAEEAVRVTLRSSRISEPNPSYSQLVRSEQRSSVPPEPKQGDIGNDPDRQHAAI